MDPRKKERMKSSPRVWLVTGASSGFGRAVTEAILAQGDAVAATARSPSSLDDLARKYPPTHLLVLKCDVINKLDVTSAFERTYAHFGRCDVVFNNAGLMIFAEAENINQEETAREMFEVNFWAAANVSGEAVKNFRENNPPGEGGTLLVNSSLAGMAGWPGLGYYCASKHALEGVTECLAMELDPTWNIKVSILEPSGYDTRPFTSGSMPMWPAHPAYQADHMPTQQERNWFKGGPGPWGDTRKAAKRIVEFSELETPPLRWPVGAPAVQAIREKLKSVRKEIDGFERWSDGLQLEGGDVGLHAKM